ncbi:MAG TPA: 3-hydroxyacyl-CoA dehydrogenase family protein [Kofleriaceae bacterium]|nr:3-hydroxyacyl-CoA dehydrogenase family protein [Kofleriaceae bacterium]
MAKVVVLGANGAMGAGSGETFAAAGIRTVFLARTRDKARQGVARAIKMAKSEAVARLITVGSYEEDLAREVADADLVFEAVAEDLETKRDIFAAVDAARRPDAIVATVSSGLSIAAMAGGRSDGFARAFLGIHLFNPPNVIVGCEVIPHAGTDPEVTAFVIGWLEGALGRQVIRTSDTPAFCGNRVGFKVLNEVAQLAAEHPPAWLDALVGPHTGRAMPPLATIDFVGWDVHAAIVDNLHASTRDEAHRNFALPDYMRTLIAAGHLGAKTPDKGGFFRKELALAPGNGSYQVPAPRPLPEFVGRIKQLHRVGRYREALAVMAEATGAEAELMRRVVLGYVSYGLNRVGEVVESAADVDRIMGYGFNWAPPSVLVDLLGARRTVALLEAARLPVPSVIADAAAGGTPLFTDGDVDPGRFFFA